VPSGTWLAAVPAGHADDPWVAGVLRVLPPGAVHLEVARPDRDALADWLRATGHEFTGVVSLLALAADADDGVPVGLTLTTALVQALGDAGIEAPLWCLTRGAVTVAPTEPLPGWPQAAVWGFGRVAALEHPRRWGGLIDLPEVFDDRCATRLAGVLADSGGEDQLAVRPGALFARRLGSAPPGRPAALWDPDGTVLVTGGTGSLGAHVSRRLAGAGARHLVLVSRSGPDAPGAGELRADLARLGAQVTIVACDAADRDAMAAVLAAIPEEVPLTAVVHAAGVLDDGVIDGLTPARFTDVFRSKITAALVLDELTRELDLRVFALFSSASGAVGNPGQASYAAANATLDALAEQRRARGLPATSIAWGAWGGAGMAADGRALTAARRTGVRPLDPDLAVLALRRVVMAADPVAVISDIETGRFIRTFSAIRPSRLLEDLPGYAELARGGDQTAGGLRRELAALPAARRMTVVLNLVRATAADVLGHGGPDSVGADRAFRDLGFDSLSSVELRNQLNAMTGLTLPATLVFDHPNSSALAEHVLRELDPGAAGDGDPDTDAGEIRKLLACVPVARLREAGILAQLLTLAGGASAPPAEPGESIDEMGVDDLVRAALNGVSHEEPNNGAHL
jgi:NAD(P)-dependent dehydrogenase (short-subunit alcohol dehydrogenase family)/acyl carrier protein